MHAPAIAAVLLAVTGFANGQGSIQNGANAHPPVAFEVATIKAVQPGSRFHLGFHSSAGGRVEFGGTTVKGLMSYAYDVQLFQISGGPAWVGTDGYAVVALPPESSPSRSSGASLTPTDEQRQMLRSLLADRFALRVHREIRQSPVYLLTRGNKQLQMKDAEDKARDPRFAVFVRGQIADGEVRGDNVSMPYVARELGMNLTLPVLDQTGLTGSYDLRVEPFDAENRDVESAIAGAMDRLGLKLKRGTGPVETIVIDSAMRPTPN